MDQIEEVAPDFVQVKSESSIVIKKKGEQEKDAKVVLTSSDQIGLKEWLQALSSTHKESVELLGSMAKKATKIYGTDHRSMAAGINTQPSSPKSVLPRSLSRQNSTPLLNTNSSRGSN